MADDNVHAEAIHDHEHTDMSITSILWFALSLVVTAILVHLVLAWLYAYFDAHKEGGEAVSPFAPPRTLPPYPRLQVSPPMELRNFRAKEDQVLTTYGWVDKSKGVVRIPIDRAMDLILERGMPATAATTTVGGMPRNPATATRGAVATPRGTAIIPGNPAAYPPASGTPATPGAKQKPQGGSQQ